MILTSALFEQLALYRGWVYGRDVSYASALPGVRLQTSPPGPRHVDCCSFVEGLVIGACVRAGMAVEWGLELHRRMMIMDPRADRFGPVESLCDAGVAWPVRADSAPPPWSVCQGWNGDRGHTFIVVDTHLNGPAEGVLILEANNAYGLNGPGWRSVGPLGTCHETTDGTPPLWYRDPRAWTWARVMDAYPELDVCALRVGAEPFAGPREPEGGGSIRA